MQSDAVIVLPPEPTPHGLTASASARSLQEHFLAFLNANNPNGFEVDAVAHISGSTVGDLMLLVALNGSIAIVDFKLEAKKLKKLSAGTLRHGHCLELLSRLFGYKNWHDANQNVKAGRLMNRRTDRGRISMKMFDVAGQN